MGEFELIPARKAGLDAPSTLELVKPRPRFNGLSPSVNLSPLKSKHQQSKRQPAPSEGGKGASSPASPAEQAARSIRRRRLFRFIAIAVPLAQLVLLEFILRACGYGYPTGFFLETRSRGQTVLTDNAEFTRRYFPPGLARSPQPCVLPAAKAADTLRVFVFGESAAMGDPEPAFGFPRILEVLLREAMPGKKIEVVNVAVTAINSHVIRDIARDCAGRHGDWWVVYMGHNEVVGPFGAGTVFGEQAPGLGVIRSGLALKRLRLGQLLDALRWKLTSKAGTPAQWAGMEMFLQQQVALDDPRMAKVDEHFEKNLGDILEIGERAGARVLLSTVAGNLKDCPPFASRHGPGLTEEQLTEWRKSYDAGSAHEQATNCAAALASYEAAARVDDRHAELQFRRARCEWTLGRFAEARRSFERARDLDALRFRADTRINERVRQAAARQRAVKFVDAEALVATNSPQGVAGGEFFFEHVHFNFAGNYLLARAFAETILEGAAVPSLAGLLSSDECARRLAFSEFDRHALLDEVRKRLQQPPFTHQLDHVARDHALREELERMRAALPTNAFAAVQELYHRAIDRIGDDWVLRENFARILQDHNEPREAGRQWRKVMELLPHNELAYYSLANVLDTEGRPAEAMVLFGEALRRRPGSVEARNGLALALASQGRAVEAVGEYEKALAAKPDFNEARVNLGQTLAELGRIEEARAHYTEALRRDSNNVPAHVNLGKVLAGQGRPADAAAHYRAALRVQPNHVAANFNLGNALNALGDAAGATRHYGEAVRAQPDLPEARYNYALGLAKLDRGGEALAQFAEAVRLKPEFAEARFNFGVALAKARRFDEAIVQFRETLRLDPANDRARKFLEQSITLNPK